MVKKFDDLSLVEKATLSSERLDHYVDLRCAEWGIPLQPKKPVKKPRHEYKKEVVGHRLYIPYNVYFKEDDAMELVQHINTNYTLYRAVDETLQRDDEVNVYTEMDLFYDEGERKAVKRQKEEFRAFDEQFEDALEAYNEIKTQREEVHKEITEEYTKAILELDRIEVLVGDYKRYQDLAGQDDDMAKKFFIDRYNEEDYTTMLNFLERCEINVQDTTDR